jgi:hypothetical protein
MHHTYKTKWIFVTILATVDLYVYENRNYFQNSQKMKSYTNPNVRSMVFGFAESYYSLRSEITVSNFVLA